MKKSLLLLCTISLGLLSTHLTNAQVAVGDIDIQGGVSTDPTNSSSVCQCDTVRVRYELKRSFSTTSNFRYQLASPNNAWGTAIDLVLVDLFTSVSPMEVNASSATDTFSGNAVGLLWADLAIPCNAPQFSNTFRIINEPTPGNIFDDLGTPELDGASDTGFYNVGRIPTIGEIDSTAYIKKGRPGRDTVFQNFYTTSNDLGICDGDTIFLRANGNGSGFQWYNGGTMMPGKTDDSLMVTSPGVYSAEIIDGGCSIFTKDTIVTFMTTPTDVEINFPMSPNAIQMDNGSPGNGTPNDSALICINESVTLRGPFNPPAGITLSYQWLSDTTNDGVDNFHVLTGDTNLNITLNGVDLPFRRNKFYVAIDDGFCRDTSSVYFVFRDTIPDVNLGSTNFPGQNPFVDMSSEICMTDSVLLSSFPAPPNSQLRYQWQWFDPNLGIWSNLPGDTFATLQVDTTLKPPFFGTGPTEPTLRSFRLRVNTFSPFGRQPVCSFITDSITVRWLPEFFVETAPSQVNTVIDISVTDPSDSVNICANDTVLLRGPASPDPTILPYQYEWLTDSVNSSGQRVLYSLNSFQRIDTITETGRYYIRIDDGICVDTSIAMWVFVDSLPSTQITDVPFTPGGNSDLRLCFTDSVQLTAMDSIAGWDYQWQRFDTTAGVWNDLPGDTFASIVIDTSFKPVQDTNRFRLKISYLNKFGLKTCDFFTDTINVLFFPPPTLSFIPSKQEGLCLGDSILLVAQGNFTALEWNNGQQLGSSIWVKDTGLIPVKATGVNGCISRDTVEVFPITVAANAGPDITINSGETAVLNGSGGNSFRWFADEPIEFNDFLSSTVRVRKVLDDNVDSDTITIFLEVTNGAGCTAIDEMNLIILNARGDDILQLERTYNVFTPNGDGLNDVWDIRELVDGDACKIQIMNRWGAPVFESESFNGIWTGVDDGGTPLPDGTYYYILSCDNSVRVKNALTLLRNE